MDNLITKAQGGDKEAFINIIRKNELSLYRTAKAILKNDEDVADAMQDTIITALEKIHTLKNPSYFKTWITKIIINKCNDILRKNNKSIHMQDFTDEVYTDDFISKVSLKEGISNLSDEQRLVIHLYYFMGFNCREISEILNEKETSIKVRLFRSRNKLKDFFQDKEGEY